MAQIPRFRERPYVEDTAALTKALADGLATSLEGDFCWSLCFSAAFLHALCYEGFLPICCELGGGSDLFVLLPKLHENRCVLRFADVHFSKKARKKAKQYVLTVGQAFGRVLACCIEQHGESWLHPPMISAFCEMGGARPGLASAGGSLEAEMPAVVAPASGAAGMLSFELWRETAASEDGSAPASRTLVAGEFGSVAGRSYTSFSGFYREDGSGAAQMALTSACLEAAGFAWWDMGQEHAYKHERGARMMPRADFLRAYRVHRTQPNAMGELLRRHSGRLTSAALLAELADRYADRAAPPPAGQAGGQSGGQARV